MSIRALFFLAAFSCPLIGAETVREFRSSLGVARMSVIPEPDGADSVSSQTLFDAAIMDTATDIPALFSRTDFPDVRLDLVYLERGTSEELRFPVRYSQVGECVARHSGEYQTGTRDERAVSVVRDLAQSLHVHMKQAASGEAK